MGSALYQALKSLKAGTEDESNGRHIIPSEVVRAASEKRPRILDIGAGYGVDLKAITEALARDGRAPEVFAIETFPNAVRELQRLGVSVASIDIEHARLPYDDDFFDVVTCNQVLEHTKEIFWIVSEIARITRPGGRIIIGVPNLGSLHNRLALLAGYQPPAIEVLGPHVRGYTVPGFTEFLETGGVLKVTKVLGGNFYPFPPKVSRWLSRLLPKLSVSSFYCLEKQAGKTGFLSVFDTPVAGKLVDTPYFRGPVA